MSNIQHIFELTYPVFSAGSAEHVIPIKVCYYQKPIPLQGH